LAHFLIDLLLDQLAAAADVGVVVMMGSFSMVLSKDMGLG